MQTLTAPAFPVTINFTWTEPNVIPPRCRNPRDVQHLGQEHTAYVPTVTPEEAPVALRLDPGNSTLDQAKEWRYYNGQLFQPYMPYSGQTEITVAGSEHFRAEVNYEGYSYCRADLKTSTLDEAKQNLDAHFSQYLILNGEVWQKTAAEPCYRVETYGHGNTSAYLSLTDSGWTAQHGEWKYFNANERQEAIEAGLALLPDSSREVSRNRMESGAAFEVLIPEAIKFHPDRITAKGREEIERYEYRQGGSVREAFKAAADQMDPTSVGRGESGYAEYLEHAAAVLIAEAALFREGGNDFNKYW